MAMTQATFVTRLRGLLDDTTVPYTWSDDVLRLCLDEGLVEYAMACPKARRVTLPTTAGQTALDLAAVLTPEGAETRRLLAVTQVQCPPGRVLGRDPALPLAPGVVAEGPTTQAYTVVGPVLYFHHPLSGDEVGADQLVVAILETWALFGVDSADATTEWDGPRYDEGLVLAMAARAAWRQAALLGLKTGTGLDPDAQIAAHSAFIAAQLRARAARPTSRLLGAD
jgi:hypothetical protein